MVRRLSFALLGFALVLGGLLGFFYYNSSPMGEIEKVDLKIDVDPELLKAHVAALTSILPVRNIENPESLNQAAAYIHAQWTEMGYAVEEQVYEDENGREYKNLVTRLGAHEGEALLIGAHYDAYGEQQGADDNASGVAGLLEVSRHLRTHSTLLKRPIIFVAWTLEEPPSFATRQMGSYVHAMALKEQGVRLVGMLSLEMIGYFSDEPGSQQLPLSVLKLIYPTTGNFIAVVGSLDGRNQASQVKRLMLTHSNIGVEAISAPTLIPGIDFSDHRSYWAAGYPGLMITDTAFYRNQNYHKVTDTIDTLDFNRMAEVVKGVLGVAIHL